LEQRFIVSHVEEKKHTPSPRDFKTFFNSFYVSTNLIRAFFLRFDLFFKCVELTHDSEKVSQLLNTHQLIEMDWKMKTTKSQMSTIPMTLVAAALAATLTGCGGGGGSTASSASGSTTPPVANTCSNGAVDYPSCYVMGQANLVTTAATPTYVSGSIQLQALNDLNSIRQSLGLGLVNQNASLDTSALNHTNYIQLNSIESHNETLGTPGFTGVDATARAKYVGYASSMGVGEVIALSYPTGKNGKYVSAINVLMDTVYHRSGILTQWITDIGFGTLTAPNSTVDTPFVSDFSTQNKQYNAPNFTMHYPLDGQTGVKTYMWAESPDPVPTIQNKGYPISFTSAAGTVLNVTSFTLSQGGITVPVTLVNSTTSPVANMLLSNDAYIVPNAYLLNSTKYTVNFTGTITYQDGSHAVPVNTTWTFTTEPTGA